ncbi:hypothetical protein MKX01_036470 [Papaver californicum]|nr:hypothetical protein MKX01_036470 [Papaver californicum]
MMHHNRLNHIMEVSDGTDTATFVAHGRLAESMLCCKVDTLIRIKEEEGDVNASKVLYEILIRQKAFQVHTPTDSRQNHLGFFQVTRFNMRKCLWACYYVHHLFNLDEATAEELEYRDNVHIDESSGYGILNDAHTAPLTSVVFGHLQMLQLNDKLF